MLSELATLFNVFVGGMKLRESGCHVRRRHASSEVEAVVEIESLRLDQPDDGGVTKL